MVFYILGIVFSFLHPTIGILLYAIVAFMWLIPDKRIEKNVLFFYITKMTRINTS